MPGGWLAGCAAPPARTGERANGRTPAWDVPFQLSGSPPGQNRPWRRKPAWGRLSR